VRRIEQTEILSVFKRCGKEKDIQCMGKVFQRIMHVCGSFGILTNDNMIELAARIVLKNSANYKGRRTSMKIFTINSLRLGKSELVRQLKKAGVIFISIKQHLQIHISGAKIRRKRHKAQGWHMNQDTRLRFSSTVALATVVKLRRASKTAGTGY